MDRRSFVTGAAAASASFSFGSGAFDGRATAQAVAGNIRPNILVIKVDQLRFPTVFPSGITDADGFLRRFMPNLHELWRHGVKFGSHFTAANACTPSRGTILTGLYSQQSWLITTILARPYTKKAPQPVLSPLFPTYGKLLRQAGYRTPYAGKWHVSIPSADAGRLDAYGFQGLTYYDPTGANLQGAYGDEARGYHNDAYIAAQAVEWLQAHAGTGAPWCLTVSLINPHDKEFFWAGTEFETYNSLFARNPQVQPFITYATANNPPVVPWQQNALKEPPALGYPSVPPNWETAASIAANKPSTQNYSRLFQELVWGGVPDSPHQRTFGIASYPPAGYAPISGIDPPYGIGVAPFDYWRRNLDSYTQIMGVADVAIGQLLDGFMTLPEAVRTNTVIVFTADHGDYAGAHGFLSGKVGALYDEAYRVPLIVTDLSGRFTAETGTLRNGLTSSVDLLPLLVSLGHGGRRDWLQGDLGHIYGGRHDVLAMLRSAKAPGRPYVLMASDEAVPAYFNFNHSPTHLVGLRSKESKLGLYAHWTKRTTDIVDDHTLETEFYDYKTPGGLAELDNLRHDPRIASLRRALLDDSIPNELQARLPGVLGRTQDVAKAEYLIYDALIRNLSPTSDQLHKVVPFGVDF